ncbi:MAG: hypothetical protein HC902_13940 [Calothrix sp. SM1_5_4]|nr:hypothetical protein [Calothrix sp. SM1_5_4]
MGFYDSRYGLRNLDEKRVNDRGNGFDGLYGVRNFRQVLRGVFYRGGANNLYHREKRRDNRNPLPDDGLYNLCSEGFKNAIYLYATGFKKAPPVVNCESSVQGRNRLVYEQLSFASKTRAILERVHAAIVNPEQGPVYAHCWNGWHASGFAAAVSLRQFCGMDGDSAVAYWIRNTDGNDGRSYDGHKRRIREFIPYSDLQIDPATRSRICPSSTGEFE